MVGRFFRRFEFPNSLRIHGEKESAATAMNWLEWYNSLAKPSWTPAPATIGLIWQTLLQPSHAKTASAGNLTTVK
jgi:hypothetical protein